MPEESLPVASEIMVDQLALVLLQIDNEQDAIDPDGFHPNKEIESLRVEIRKRFADINRFSQGDALSRRMFVEETVAIIQGKLDKMLTIHQAMVDQSGKPFVRLTVDQIKDSPLDRCDVHPDGTLSRRVCLGTNLDFYYNGKAHTTIRSGATLIFHLDACRDGMVCIECGPSITMMSEEVFPVCGFLITDENSYRSNQDDEESEFSA